MKALEFSSLLLQVADFLNTSDAGKAETAMRGVAAVFDAAPDKAVSDVVKRLQGVQVPAASMFETKVLVALNAMSAFHTVLKGIAKATVEKDVALVANALKLHEKASLDGFVTASVSLLQTSPASGRARRKTVKKPLREDLVEMYRRLLEEALGDDLGFSQVFAQLQADSQVGGQEMCLLAKRFAHSSVKSRSPALKKIDARHQALLMSRARSAATAGRIAG